MPEGISFTVRPGESIPGFLKYVRREYAINFVPAYTPVDVAGDAKADTATLNVHTLQMVFQLDSGRILFPFGYCPDTSWKPASLTRSDSVPGIVQCAVPGRVHAGEGFNVTASWGEWRFDPESSILRTDVLDGLADTYVEIADGVVLGLEGEDLVTVELEVVIEA